MEIKRDEDKCNKDKGDEVDMTYPTCDSVAAQEIADILVSVSISW